MESTNQFDSLSFILNGGLVSVGVALLLATMSVSSWYLILTKTTQAVRLQRLSQKYIHLFWQAATVQQALDFKTTPIPASRLAEQAIQAAEHHQRQTATKLADICNQDEFIARSMRRNVAEEQAQLEYGLTVLASVGSVAPFIGLFGTVWGIYHALASISASGQATLDKVAGPVGEALIMTALGLAVAIPAVLAYNALVRRNRVLMGQLETFAHDLHTMLTTGSSLRAGHTLKPVHLKEIQV
jgi:biopolymer transport protein ExbB